MVSSSEESLLLNVYNESNELFRQNKLSWWQPEIVRHCPDVPFVLVGTKCDIIPTDIKTRVKHSGACAMAKRIKAAKYVECSSLTGEGLADVFTGAIEAVLDVCPSKGSKTNTEKTCAVS